MRFFISWQMNHCWVRTYKLVVYACTVYLEDTDLLTLLHWKLKREILIRGSCNINTLSISSLCISFPLFIIKCECSKTGLKLFTAKRYSPGKWLNISNNLKRFTFNRITMQALKRIEQCSLKKREKFYYFINIKIKNIKRNKNKKNNTNDTK